MQLLVLVLVMCIAIGMAINLRNLLSSRNILSIYAVFAAGRLLSHTIEPDRWLELADPVRVAMIFATACVGVRLGYVIMGRNGKEEPSRNAYRFRTSTLLAVGLVCQFVGLIGWLGAVATTGFSVLNVAALLTGDERYLGETPLVLDLAMHFATAGVALLSLRIDSARRLLETFVLALPSLTLAIVLSRRSLIIPLLIFPLFCYWLRVSRLETRKAITAVVILLSISTSLLAMRFYYGFGWEREEGGLQASVVSGFLMHFGEADPVLTVLDHHGNMQSTDWARVSWVAWCYELVPKAIAGEKPTRRIVPVAVAQEFFGSIDKHSGLPPTVIGTLFLTGGLPALIAGSAVTGMLMRVADNVLQRWRWDDWALPIGIWIWMAVALFFFRLGDLSVAVGQVIVQSLALLLVVSCLRVIYVRSHTYS